MRAKGSVALRVCVLIVGLTVMLSGGCKRKLEELPPPKASAEAYYVTDSFETIYRALTNPHHTDIDKYNIWAAYRGKRIKWAAELFSAKREHGAVLATFAFVYDKSKSKLLGGAEVLFEGKEGEKLLRVAAPSKWIVFEGTLASYYFTQDGALMIRVSGAKVVEE